MSKTRNTDFRYDLLIGQCYEQELEDIFLGKKVEVKADLFYQKSGNIYVEYKSRGKLSGLSTSEADYYCYTLPRNDKSCSFHIFKSSEFKQALKDAIKNNEAKIVKGGDNGTSEGILIKFNTLLKYL